ncbi:hypothetical protein HCG51_01110 [Tolypothrix sp. PCC 7910]|uniref:hypothetical protein n=1 Tax=Tolypothrix sp. PCC 7910 TaxID=2099387 RepID=UPI00142777B8|nr:hypothetical protein [Tolypothrix sp. PCC 7910]QIR35484.1 hypothetical protein HCG51_01110 [Tolypothrix sp. PCC 7910]
MKNNLFANSQSNKISYRHPNNWLHKLLHCKFITISSNADIPTNGYLEKIIEEYRRLITICEPSQAQQRRLEQILELAVYDTILSKSIDRVEKEMVIQLRIHDPIDAKNSNLNHSNQAEDLKEGSYLNNSDKIVVLPLPRVSHQPKKTYVCKQSDINIMSAILGVTVTLLGVYLFNPCTLFDTKEGKQIAPKSSTDTKLVQIPNFSEYYLPKFSDSFNQENFNRINNNISLQAVGLPANQQIAENKQICFETKQRLAEQQQQQAEEKQRLAEERNSLKEAKKWKYEAQKYLRQAQSYLDTVKNYTNAHKSFPQTQEFYVSLQENSINTPNPNAACP